MLENVKSWLLKHHFKKAVIQWYYLYVQICKWGKKSKESTLHKPVWKILNASYWPDWSHQSQRKNTTGWYRAVGPLAAVKRYRMARDIWTDTLPTELRHRSGITAATSQDQSQPSHAMRTFWRSERNTPLMQNVGLGSLSIFRCHSADVCAWSVQKTGKIRHSVVCAVAVNDAYRRLTCGGWGLSPSNDESRIKKVKRF